MDESKEVKVLVVDDEPNIVELLTVNAVSGEGETVSVNHGCALL